MPDIAQRRLAALAILKVNWDKAQRDYVSSFVPFVVECIRSAGSDVVSLPQLQKDVHSRFGFTLPLNTLRTLLRRSSRMKFLYRKDGVYYRNKDQCEVLQFAEREKSVDNIRNTVITALQRYAKKEHDVDWDSSKTETELLAFLEENDVSVLFAAAEGHSSHQGTSGPRYIVSSFVYDAQTGDHRLFDDIVTLAKGSMLSNALFLVDPGRAAERFHDTRVFLDTGFLINAVGYAGADREAPARELLDLLHEFGAELRCFPGTLSEMQGILDACAARIRRGELEDAHGTTLEYFIGEGYTSTDVDLLAARLPEKLRFLRIELEEPPPYRREHVIDEPSFEEFIEEEIGYRNEAARVHDVNCVAAVARIRAGREPRSVERCKALFITTNVALARAIRRFFQPEATLGSVPLCYTDHALGNLLWLKDPLRAPDLPAKALIAQAYAAMQPSDDMWTRYLTEIARMRHEGEVTDNDYHLLRYTLASRRAVMDLTLGDPEAFSEGTVTEVLEIAKRHVRADLERELREEVEHRSRTEAELVAAKEELHRQKRREREAKERVAESMALRGRQVARWIMLLPKVVLYTGLIVGAVYAFPWDLPAMDAAWFRYALSLALVLTLVLTVAGAGWGLSMRHVFERIERDLATWLGRKFLNWYSTPVEGQTSAPSLRDGDPRRVAGKGNDA